MTRTNEWGSPRPALTDRQLVYQIIGFDRLSFVGDVANAVPQDEHCRISGLSFEGDGIRVPNPAYVRRRPAHNQKLTR